MRPQEAGEAAGGADEESKKRKRENEAVSGLCAPVPAASSVPQLKERRVTMADIGCGYGGLTVGLAKEYPQQAVLGLEIRDQVVDYVRQRIECGTMIIRGISPRLTDALSFPGCVSSRPASRGPS